MTAGKPNNLLRAGQRSLQVGYENRALMREDSFSEQAGLSMDWPIMELTGWRPVCWGGDAVSIIAWAKIFAEDRPCQNLTVSSD